jgi:hypothetical protein
MRREHTRLRVKRLESKTLPEDPYDVDTVQQWMDDEEYVLTVSPSFSCA